MGQAGLVQGAAHDMKQMGRVLQLPCMGAGLSHVFGPLHILNAPTVHLEYFPKGGRKSTILYQRVKLALSLRAANRINPGGQKGKKV